jgi:putative protease
MPENNQPIGEVTHYYNKIGVAIVKFFKTIPVGTRVRFHGATTDFEQTISSMQFDHKEISEAKKNQEVGIKVDSKVREGDKVYEVK